MRLRCLTALLLCAARTLLADSQNRFVRPSTAEAQLNWLGNAVWPVGSIQSVKWMTTNTTYNVSFWQQSLTEGSALLWSDIYTADDNGSGNHSIDWVVQLYGADLAHSTVFFFWIEKDDHETPIETSAYFNISDQQDMSISSSSVLLPTTSSLSTSVGAASTTISLSTSVGAASTTTLLSTSVGAASTNTSATSASATLSPSVEPTANPPTPEKKPLKIGLGVGLGVGIPLVVLGAALVFRAMQRSRPAEPSNNHAQHQSELPSSVGHSPRHSEPFVSHKQAVDSAPPYELSESQAFYEAPGHGALVELPAKKH